jgi:hypothetical protein
MSVKVEWVGMSTYRQYQLHIVLDLLPSILKSYKILPLSTCKKLQLFGSILIPFSTGSSSSRKVTLLSLQILSNMFVLKSNLYNMKVSNVL